MPPRLQWPRTYLLPRLRLRLRSRSAVMPMPAIPAASSATASTSGCEAVAPFRLDCDAVTLSRLRSPLSSPCVVSFVLLPSH